MDYLRVPFSLASLLKSAIFFIQIIPIIDMTAMMNQLKPFPSASKIPNVQENNSAIGSSISFRFIMSKKFTRIYELVRFQHHQKLSLPKHMLN